MFRVIYRLDMTTEGYTKMSQSRHRHKSRHKPRSKPKDGIATVDTPKQHPTRIEKIKEGESVFTTGNPAFFHKVRNETAGANQTTNINVNIQPADNGQKDCATGCFRGLIKCFK